MPTFRRFKPTDIAGCRLWLSGDYLVGNDGDALSAWADRSGQGRDAAQATGSQQPLLKKGANGINGRNVVKFDGVDDRMTFTTASITAFTVFICYSVHTKGAIFGGPFSWGTTGEAGFILSANEGTTGLYTPHLTIKNAADVETSNQKGPNQYSIPYGPVIEDWDSAPVYFRSAFSQTLAAGASGYGLAGAIGFGNDYLGVNVAEIIVYDTALSAANKAKVRRYLSGKYFIPIASSSTLNTSIVGYWDLNEASGTRYDSVAVSNFTPYPALTAGSRPPIQQTGKITSSIEMQAFRSQYITTPDNANISTGDIDFTVAGWFWLESIAQTMPILTKGDWFSDKMEYSIWFYVSTNRFVFEVSDGGSNFVQVFADNFGALSIRTWYFVAGWHNSVANTANISVNNGAVNSLAYTFGGSDNTLDLTIGGNSILITPPSSEKWFSGRVCEVGLWKKVLSAGELTELYNSGVGKSFPF
jgi:hypothetical protein